MSVMFTALSLNSEIDSHISSGLELNMHSTELSNRLNNTSPGSFCLKVVGEEAATGWHQTKKIRQTFDLQIIFSFLFKEQ